MAKRLRVALLGEGDLAARWEAAQVSLGAVLSTNRSGSFDALVVAPGARDAFAEARQALQSRTPVLFAAPQQLSAHQVAMLAGLGARYGVLLRFAESFRHRAGFPFLQRMLGGSEPLWRPLYVRAVVLAGPDAQMDELAIQEVATVTALLGGAAESVYGYAAHLDGGEMSAVFVSWRCPNGAVANITITLAEGGQASQLVVATTGRTVVLDDLDPMAAVRVLEQSAAEGSVAKLLAATSPDPISSESRLFLDAVACGDPSLANGQRWARITGLWQAARHSIRLGAGQSEPPRLSVIEGGGQTGAALCGRPTLRLVSG